VREICGISDESSEIVKRHLSQIFWSTLFITHYGLPANHFALHREHLFACPSLNILHHCLTVSSLIHFGHKLLCISAALMFLARRKWITA
jgi:hypothetical protein